MQLVRKLEEENDEDDNSDSDEQTQKLITDVYFISLKESGERVCVCMFRFY